MAGHIEVLFHGEVYASVPVDKAQADMARLFRQSPEAVARIFNGKTWVLKDGLDRETAERYQVELAKIGLISELRDRSPAYSAKPEASPHGKSQNFTIESIKISRMTCPACAYEQLEADYCARCGANIEKAKKRVKQKEREDRVIEERIQSLRRNEAGQAAARPAPKPGGMAAQLRMEAPTQPLEAASGGRAGIAIWVALGIGAALVVAAVLVVLDVISLPI